MLNERAAEYRRQAEECRQQAARTFNDRDRETWLRMSQEWLALAVSVEERAEIARKHDAKGQFSEINEPNTFG